MTPQTELVVRVLNEIRESGKKMTVICPVVGEFIARNPEYLDLLDNIKDAETTQTPLRHNGVGEDCY